MRKPNKTIYLKNKTIYLKKDSRVFKKGDLVMLFGGSASARVTQVYKNTLWRKIIGFFGFKTTIFGFKLLSKGEIKCKLNI